MKKYHHNAIVEDERGAALVEFGFGLFVLLILLIGVAEISRLQNNYYGLVRVAREAVGYGIRTELVANQTCTSTYSTPCSETSHILMHDRAKYLTQELAKDINLDDTLVWESHLTDNSAAPEVDDTLRFTVQAEIPALFGAFNYPVSVTVVGGYFGNPDAGTATSVSPLFTRAVSTDWTLQRHGGGDWGQGTRDRS